MAVSRLLTDSCGIKMSPVCCGPAPCAVPEQRSAVSCSGWSIRGQQTERTGEPQQLQLQQEQPLEPVRVRAVCFKLFILSSPLGRD